MSKLKFERDFIQNNHNFANIPFIIKLFDSIKCYTRVIFRSIILEKTFNSCI